MEGRPAWRLGAAGIEGITHKYCMLASHRPIDRRRCVAPSNVHRSWRAWADRRKRFRPSILLSSAESVAVAPHRQRQNLEPFIQPTETFVTPSVTLHHEDPCKGGPGHHIDKLALLSTRAMSFSLASTRSAAMQTDAGERMSARARRPPQSRRGDKRAGALV